MDIVHELEVIKDSEFATGFSFDKGYFGDAVRVNIHKALVKVDALLGVVAVGGGEVPTPEPTELVHTVYGSSMVSGIYSPSLEQSSIIGFAETAYHILTDASAPEDWESDYGKYYAYDTGTSSYAQRTQSSDAYEPGIYATAEDIDSSEE